MALLLGLNAASKSQLIRHWWQWVLIILIGLSILVGSSFLLYQACRKLFSKLSKRRSSYITLQKSTEAQIEAAIAQLPQHGFEKSNPVRPSSFGVYLGSFDSPPTVDQAQMLSQWDLVILDPFEVGVVDAVRGCNLPEMHAVARISVRNADTPDTSADELAIHLIHHIIETMQLSGSSSDEKGNFAGVMLSHWENCFSRPMLHYVVNAISSLGLQVYLEISAPDFLQDTKVLESDAITGLVIRNATVLPNGEHRDVFDMGAMKVAIKAFVSQSCLRKFTVLVWDVVDEEVEPSNAVIKRGFQWCRFYNALLWVGPDPAQRDATLNGVQKEPLGAFDWLKEARVVSFHQIWRSNVEIRDAPHSNYSTWLELEDMFPSIGLLKFSREKRESDQLRAISPISLAPTVDEAVWFSAQSNSQLLQPLNWTALYESPIGHPLSVSPTGESYDYLGCFPLGIHVSKEAFIEVSSSQQRLLGKALLDTLPCSRMQEIGQVLHDFCEHRQTQSSSVAGWLHSVRELARHLKNGTESEGTCNFIRVFIGLDTGFHSPAPLTGMFWGVYSQNDDMGLDIFISRNVRHDMTGVILHTFLSSQGFSRCECLQAEVALAQWSNSLNVDCRLPQRFVSDIDMLSPSEIILFRQFLKLSEQSKRSRLVSLICSACEAQLLDGSDFVKRKDVSTAGYLSGNILAEELVTSRVDWYEESDGLYLTVTESLAIFNEVQQTLRRIVTGRQDDDLLRITDALETILQPGSIDALSDILALSIFCYMRKEALDEVYMEVCDRNPLFNDQSDQAAAFAELFAVGSRCESYFDVTPSVLGKLLSDRYRHYYRNTGHAEPPLWLEDGSQLQSAYSAAQIDIAADSKRSEMSGLQQFSFLSVFAIPALIDILLLTTTGRGLYLSSYMSDVEKIYATLALMISLLLSGAIGSWITCGGSYYLISMAFSAMNMFVATRLVAGFAFTIVVALIGFLAVGVSHGPVGGVVFFLYLLALTSYLSLLATLANFQYPGSAFQSGRPIIICVIPVLFISPVITIWVHGYDLIVYLSVFYFFISLLLLGVKQRARKWSVWFLDIKVIKDAEVRNWYFQNRADEDKETLMELTYPKSLKVSREALLKEILQSLKKWPLRQKTVDPFVARLAKSYRANLFLLEWYCGFTGSQAPIPYSSTWNAQTKIALRSLEQLQTGIRLHNAFIHWRKAGDEVGCSILYFIVALLDKWIALVCGGQVIGFLNFGSELRVPVGFSLAYYLIGAVFLDYNAAAIHNLAGKGHNTAIGTISELPKAVKSATQIRRRLYWKMLGRYTLFHVWSLALASCLLWIFATADEDTTILFVSYVGAYTGLLWFQYTKIFSGPKTLKPLLFAVCIGIPLGLLLRTVAPGFGYNDVIALAVATWTAAIMSIYSAGILSKSVKEPFQPPQGVYHSYGAGPDQGWSQLELQTFYRKFGVSRGDASSQINPNSNSGLEIKSYLSSALARIRGSIQPKGISEAFPNAYLVIEKCLLAFENGDVILECVPSTPRVLVPSIQAISREWKGTLHVLISHETDYILSSESNTGVFCKLATEILLHSVAETFVGFSHDDALLLESLVLDPSESSLELNIPHSIEYQLRSLNAPQDLSASLCRHFQQLHLQFLSLGIDCDVEWDQLPRDIRELLLKRFAGEKCEFSANQAHWLCLKISRSTTELSTYIARCDFGAAAMLACKNYAHRANEKVWDDNSSGRQSATSIDVLSPRVWTSSRTWKDLLQVILLPLGILYHSLGSTFKFMMVAFVADSDLQRELDYVLNKMPTYVRRVGLVVTTGIWIYAKFAQSLLLPLFLLRGRKTILAIWKNIEGTTISIKRNFISIESSEGSLTGFVHFGEDGAFEIRQYVGKHQHEPADLNGLRYTNSYSKDMCLRRRDEYHGSGSLAKSYAYEYLDLPQGRRKRLSKLHNTRYPILRKCIEGDAESQIVYFDHKGRVESGSYLRHGNFVQFRCHYRVDGSSTDDLLRAEFVLPHLTCTVSWAARSVRNPERLEKWVPHSQVTEATFVLGADVYESKWRYDHKFHPAITTALNGMVVETPPLILYDHLGVLTKPTRFSFLDDDPVASFSSIHSTILSRWGFSKNFRRVSTSEARSRLWKAWRDTPGLDGVTARWLDERLLRRDPFMKPYWHDRDRGRLESATAFLETNADMVMASVDLDGSISGFAPLAIKIGDLFSFGQGGDANNRTRSQRNPEFDDSELQVLAADTGTWPNEGGGVSACRRDMINNLKNVKWHMIAESANDFGVPKHQTEQNVQSLKLIPLWGLDFLTPTHGLFQNRLDSEVAPTLESMTDIETNFIPILATLVKGARTVEFSKTDLHQATRALVDLNTYFEGSKNWGATWTSDSVKAAWRNLWIAQGLVVPCHSTTWFQAEIPSIAQLDLALEIWYRYLFIFSIPIPEKIPPIFQASHHSISSSYGIVCKMKRGSILQIWDHAISWRETNLYLSSALCNLSPFVRNALLGLMKVTSVLVLHHADTILPCADVFNPGWEIEIGTCQGEVESRKTFKRKVDPIINGITDSSKFAEVKEIKTTIPTVTMLSHVWYAKDIKTAILSADIIINDWGFKDYHLDIYGALDKAPAYSTDCQEIIASKSLHNNVRLRGEADPIEVLENTWLFLNSSISEGLPLALGEAALTGAPVVCTDVGASLRILTDPDDGSCYSSIVAPNDARALARAQIKMLGMLDEWSVYAEDSPDAPIIRLSESPKLEETVRITQRMYEKKEQRRALGMRSRAIIQKSFGGDRYLREHEQMLWVGKAQRDMMKGTSSSVRNSRIQSARISTVAAHPVANAIVHTTVTIHSEVVTMPSAAAVSAPTQPTQQTQQQPSIFSDISSLTTPPSTVFYPGVAESKPLQKLQPVRVDIREFVQRRKSLNKNAGPIRPLRTIEHIPAHSIVSIEE